MDFIFWIVAVVIAVMSIVGFAVMGYDKLQAKKGKWRVPEVVLFAIALFGGVGSTIGMLTFRHKTQHWYFKLFFPLFAIVDIAVIVVAYFYCI